MKYLFILFLSFITFLSLKGQDKLSLEAPMLIEATAGETIIFKVNWDQNYEIYWSSDIDSLKFDPQEGEFFWEHTKAAIGLHTVNLALKDSLGNILHSTRTLIQLHKSIQKPVISFYPDSLNGEPYIELKQGTPYQLEFEATSANSRKDVLLSYLINDNASIKAFDQSELTVIGNKLVLRWQPNQEQANRRYHDLELIAIDQDNQITREKYNFLIHDVDLPPKWKYSLNPQYTISPNRKLTIDFSVIDPDGDDYYYQAKLSTNVGLSTTDQAGQFSWQLSPSEMASISQAFPVSLTLDVIHPQTGLEVMTREIEIVQTRDNAVPKITRLSNLSVKEGYAIKRRVFYQDNNHSVSQLDFKLENAPNWLYLEQEDEALYLKSDTIPFDVVKADGIAIQYDVLLTVTDPLNASDNQFFTITVNEGINADDIYDKYVSYTERTDAILGGIRAKTNELEQKLDNNAKMKKGFLYTSILLGGYSGIASFFDDHTVANQAVPYTGAILAITSSINALAFNQDGDITTVKVKLEQIEKELIRNKSFLQLFDINSDRDEQLRNPEVSDKIKSYRQQLIGQLIELEKLEQEYRQLNYVKRKLKKAQRKQKPTSLEWGFLN